MVIHRICFLFPDSDEFINFVNLEVDGNLSECNLSDDENNDPGFNETIADDVMVSSDEEIDNNMEVMNK